MMWCFYFGASPRKRRGICNAYAGVRIRRSEIEVLAHQAESERIFVPCTKLSQYAGHSPAFLFLRPYQIDEAFAKKSILKITLTLPSKCYIIYLTLYPKGACYETYQKNVIFPANYRNALLALAFCNPRKRGKRLSVAAQL